MRSPQHCLGQSPSWQVPRAHALCAPSTACAAEQALGTRLLMASLPHPAVPRRVGPHPSGPVSPWLARSKPATVQLPCSPTALSPYGGCSSESGQDYLFLLSQTLSPQPSHRVCPFLCAFFFFSFNVPVLIYLLRAPFHPVGNLWPPGLSSLRLQ